MLAVLEMYFKFLNDTTSRKRNNITQLGFFLCYWMWFFFVECYQVTKNIIRIVLHLLQDCFQVLSFYTCLLKNYAIGSMNSVLLIVFIFLFLEKNADLWSKIKGIGKLSTADGKAFADPEVLRRLTSSVSCALDEAAAALTRMRAESTVNSGQMDK